MKKFILFLLTIFGILQSCTKRAKIAECATTSSDSLVLMQHINEDLSDSTGIRERNYNERPTHAAHYSANLPHYHNGQYHNGNY